MLLLLGKLAPGCAPAEELVASSSPFECATMWSPLLSSTRLHDLSGQVFGGMKSHHFEIWVAVRIGFAEVLKMVTLHTISAA